MSYLVLARKYRPKTFEEMVGQEHVLKTLVNSLNNASMHHAYLFAGTRGVGKTTVARILAKCLNNESGITATPDLDSQTSKDIDRGGFVDLIEVDAASRTKVEQTRELLENINYPPAQGRFKIYLIDEVHMLSNHSFNALLKTLEEPPEHVKFLLATTEAQKLPITIVSRCLQFNLKQIPVEQIEKHLAKVLDQENIEHDSRALHLLARAGMGSLRDALSIMDQAIAYTNRNVAAKEIAAFLGTTDSERLNSLIHALISGDAGALLKAVNNLSQFLVDYHSLIDDLLLCLQRAAIIQLVPDYRLPDQDEHQQAKSIAEALSPEKIQLFYQIALRGKRELDLVVNERSALEMILLRMLAFAPATRSEQVVTKPDDPKTSDEISPQTESDTYIQQPVIENKDFANIDNDDWINIYSSVKLTGFVQQILGYAQLVEYVNDSIIFLIGETHQKLLTDDYKTQIDQAMSKLLGQQKIEVVFQTQAELPEHSPLMTKKRRQQQTKVREQELVEQDPEVKVFVDQFDATIVDTRSAKSNTQDC